MTDTTEPETVDPTRLAGGIPRASAARQVVDHFSSGNWHVHLHGPPGFGKRDVITSLKEPAGGIVIVDLEGGHVGEVGVGQLKALAEELGPASYDLSEWSSYTLAQGWKRIISILEKRSDKGRPIIVFEHAELLLTGAGFEWPTELGEYADVLTTSIAPLDLLNGSRRRFHKQRSLELGPFPTANTNDDPLSALVPVKRWKAQDDQEFESDGLVWRDAFLARHTDILSDDVKRVSAAFDLYHVKRRDEVWDGHPYLDTALTEHLLDTVARGDDARGLNQAFNNILGREQGSRDGRLAEILLVRDGGDKPQSPVLLRGVADVIQDCINGTAELDSEALEWGYASGLITFQLPKQDGTPNWRWTRIATLIHPDPASDAGIIALRNYATELASDAKYHASLLDDIVREADSKFAEIRDLVELAYCRTDQGKSLERQIDTNPKRTRPIVEELLYKFSLTYRPTDRQDEEKFEKSRVTLLVFEVEDDKPNPIGLNMLNHNVRALSLLGRQHHRALPAFRNGGMLSADDSVLRPRPYIEIEEAGEPLARDARNKLIKHLTRTGAIESTEKKGGPSEALRQVALLAEALALIHQAGLFHRFLDFNSLLMKTDGSLAISGFEQSALLRFAMHDGIVDRHAVFQGRVENLACRTHEVLGGNSALTIDPSVDVYAFGALAMMILTGLPSHDSIAKHDSIKSELKDQQTDFEEIQDWQDRVFKVLNEELRSDRRWETIESPHASQVKKLLDKCLSPDRSERPSMEAVSAKLKYLVKAMAQDMVREADVLAVAYNPKVMGEMIRNLRPALIPEDTDLETRDGRALLQNYIRTWLQDTRWLHYSKFGFPKPGKTSADENRLESKYALVGGPVVFYASPYNAQDGLGPRMDWLWLSYSMHAAVANFPTPDPVDDARNERNTDEPVPWVELRNLVEAFPSDEIANEAKEKKIVSWDAITDELKLVADVSGKSQAGREAGISWKVHRDYHRALERLREFPAIAIDNGDNTYALRLDVEAFHKENMFGELAFYRQVIIEGEDPRAFFEEQLTTTVEEETGTGEWIRLRRRGTARGSKIDVRVRSVEKNKVGEGEVLIELGRDSVGTKVPKKVRVSMFSSVGTNVAIERQTNAIDRLMLKREMLQTLISPRDSSGLKPMLSNVCGKSVVPEGASREELRQRVQILLASDKLTAVQGPPGTGKTTLQAATVDEILRWQDGTRLLITSQSHAATDNVLLSVVSMIEDQARISQSDTEADAIRIFSNSAEDRVDPVVRKRFSVEARIRKMRERIRLSGKTRPGQEGDDMRKARDALNDVSYLELKDRLERSAPLVFATTGASAEAFDLLPDRMLAFDIALIDEAAKAWALDLVVPMSIADQVIAVGDPEQLPPYGEQELGNFLKKAQAHKGRSDIPADVDWLLGTAAESKGGEPPFQRMNRWLRPFHRILEEAPPRKLEDVGSGIPVTQMLNRQFRSVKAIGDIVSNTFYKSSIISQGPKPDPDRRLSVPAERMGENWRPAVVWIDTSKGNRGRFTQQTIGRGHLTNSGEIEVVRAIFDGQVTADDPEPWKNIRILSPYKAQVQSIKRQYLENPGMLGVPSELISKIVTTADSSQGSESEVVAISLCRRNANALDQHLADVKDFLDDEDLNPRQIKQLEHAVHDVVGFLVSPERLNVICSRARQQLMIIGDYTYYEKAAMLIHSLYKAHGFSGTKLRRITFWARLLDAFVPFDPDIHKSGDGLETPVIVPAEYVLEARSNG